MRKELEELERIDWPGHALFLDFDGTLAPIVPRPEDAAVDPPTAEALLRLQGLTGGALAIISGRDLDDLDRRLAPLLLPAAGSHGTEMRDAAGRRRMIANGAERMAPAATTMAAFASREGLMLERKAGATTIHYRARPELASMCRALVESLADGAPGLRALHGHLVSEIVLEGVDKGRALRAFMADAPYAGRRPVAIGDDTTDEDAFAAAQDAGGLGVKIGEGRTCARVRIGRIEDFLAWLQRSAAADPAREAGGGPSPETGLGSSDWI